MTRSDGPKASDLKFEKAYKYWFLFFANLYYRVNQVRLESIIMSLQSWGDNILKASHRWVLFIAFFVVGSTVGWLATYIWPSPYRATIEFDVALDPHRTMEETYVNKFAQVDFGNVTDFKHWQMSQLEVLAMSDEYINETLTRLQVKEPYWYDINLKTMRRMLHLSWRNAGKWWLTAENSNSNHAVQAVNAWSGVILEKTDAALINARKLYLLDMQLQAVINAKLSNESRVVVLADIRTSLTSWQNRLDSSLLNKPLNQLERWRLYSLAGQVAGFNLAWEDLLGSFPTIQASTSVYLPWVERVIIALDAQVQATKITINERSMEQTELSQQWDETLQLGRGLSATLSVDKIDNGPPSGIKVRSASLTASIGGILGLLVWALWVFVRISYKQS
jgi:hypothetical protein